MRTRNEAETGEEVEHKRALAKQWRGVSYEPRSRKFCAAIVVMGARRWLGSYDTAEAAGAVYALARAQSPVLRGQRGRRLTADGLEERTVPEAYADFLKAPSVVGEHGRPAVGASWFLFGGADRQEQHYTLVEVRHRMLRGRKFGLFVWRAECLACGDEFTTTTLLRARVVHGMVRHCVRHRRKSRRWPTAEEKAAALGAAGRARHAELARKG